MTKFMYAALLVGLVGSTAVNAQTTPPAACNHTNPSNPTLCDQATNLYTDITATLSKEVADLVSQGNAGSGSVLSDAQGLIAGTARNDLYNIWVKCQANPNFQSYCTTLNGYYSNVGSDITALQTAVGNLSTLKEDVASAVRMLGPDASSLVTLVSALNSLYSDYNTLNGYHPPVEAKKR
jgi:hypothetical protein